MVLNHVPRGHRGCALRTIRHLDSRKRTAHERRTDELAPTPRDSALPNGAWRCGRVYLLRAGPVLLGERATHVERGRDRRVARRTHALPRQAAVLGSGPARPTGGGAPDQAQPRGGSGWRRRGVPLRPSGDVGASPASGGRASRPASASNGRPAETRVGSGRGHASLRRPPRSKSRPRAGRSRGRSRRANRALRRGRLRTGRRTSRRAAARRDG